MTEKTTSGAGRQKRFTDAFKAEAVQLVKTSGLPLRAVAEDLGVGLSILGKWVGTEREADLLAGPHPDVGKELARLRKENEILRQERDLLKKAAAFFAKETMK